MEIDIDMDEANRLIRELKAKNEELAKEGSYEADFQYMENVGVIRAIRALCHGDKKALEEIYNQLED